ncbi:hypothetical protein LCGC14_1123590 [marine sediment metagenome]|uniref:Uncharacterized protein n=1 Tax=marine sediment metagenome TaxID=412755 RepID=A0A0F9MR41_9ZZZZ
MTRKRQPLIQPSDFRPRPIWPAATSRPTPEWCFLRGKLRWERAGRTSFLSESDRMYQRVQLRDRWGRRAIVGRVYVRGDSNSCHWNGWYAFVNSGSYGPFETRAAAKRFAVRCVTSAHPRKRTIPT